MASKVILAFFSIFCGSTWLIPLHYHTRLFDLNAVYEKSKAVKITIYPIILNIGHIVFVKIFAIIPRNMTSRNPKYESQAQTPNTHY